MTFHPLMCNYYVFLIRYATNTADETFLNKRVKEKNQLNFSYSKTDTFIRAFFSQRSKFTISL